MPEETRYTDDNLEFSGEIEEIVSRPSETFPDDRAPAIKVPGKKKLLKLADDSALSPGQAQAFLSAVELDMARKAEDRTGLADLYHAFCEHGTVYWLNPSPSLKKLDDVLFRYACHASQRRDVMLPLMELLTDLARKKINPTAFLDYIMVPRLLTDYDWRNWITRHLEPFQIIGDILVRVGGNSPFNREKLGDDHNRLSRDIVLTKYVGRPLAMYPLAQLASEELRDRYIAAWGSLSLDNAFTIIFMKTNVLHFMYALSGKIDFLQLSQLIENMPEIEAGFRENYPANNFTIDLRKIDFDLYSYDIAESLVARKNRGFSSYDFIVEIKAYLKIISSLLETNSGLYLCGFFARRLSALKDPVIAGTLARLVDSLSDNGGMHIYTWHTKRLLSKKKTDHAAYIDFIEENNGCDPEYPFIESIFFDPAAARENADVRDAASRLGIPADEIEAASTRAPLGFKDLLGLYMKHNPGSRESIEDYRDQFLAGRDRDWDSEMVTSLDMLGRDLHGPLLRAVIRGIGTGFSGPLKSASFDHIFRNFGSANLLPVPEIRRHFAIPVRETGNLDRLREQEIRKSVNLDLIKTVLADLIPGVSVSPNAILAIINRFSLDLNRPLEKTRNALAALTGEMQTEKEGIKKARRLEKTLSVLEAQKSRYEEIMDSFNSLDDTGKLLTGIIMAADKSKTGEDFASTVSRLIVARYNSDESLAARIDFLRSDIAPDMITYRQLNNIINTVEVLIDHVASDQALSKLITSEKDRDLNLKRSLSEYTVTRAGEINEEALEAAIKRIFSYSRLTAERAKWQSIIESIERRDAKYFREYSLYVSKSAMDSYYGDMGAICLSMKPHAIKWKTLYNIRLVSETDREIVGMALLYLSDRGIRSYRKDIGEFWHAFAFNPLRSLTSGMGRSHQLYLYLQYRQVLEEVALRTGKPVVLPGISSWGIISNDSAFRDLILAYEKRYNPVQVSDAWGLSLYYSEEQYADACVIIDPCRRNTFVAGNDLRNINL